MKEVCLRDLRKSKNMSQKDFAEKLSVPIATIRKWEKNEVLPSMQDMFFIAKVLEVQNDDIIKMFKTRQTLIEKNNLREVEACETLENLFWGIDSVRKFIMFFSLLSYMNIKGTIYSEKYLFPYSKIIANPDEDGIVVSDDNNNLIVFTFNNVKSIKPISANYDVYIFEIVLLYSIFPLEESENILSNVTIKLSVYSR